MDDPLASIIRGMDDEWENGPSPVLAVPILAPLPDLAELTPPPEIAALAGGLPLDPDLARL